MKLHEFKAHLAGHAAAPVRFILPDGTPVAAHAHVTEVARIEKHFVDCGGTQRADAFCRLQTWVADDLDHRLTAGKLLSILERAAGLLKSEELEVDVEHELEYITQCPLQAATATASELQLQLGVRHTDCLAKDRCLPPLNAPQAIRLGKSRPILLSS